MSEFLSVGQAGVDIVEDVEVPLRSVEKSYSPQLSLTLSCLNSKSLTHETLTTEDDANNLSPNVARVATGTAHTHHCQHVNADITLPHCG